MSTTNTSRKYWTKDIRNDILRRTEIAIKESGWITDDEAKHGDETDFHRMILADRWLDQCAEDYKNGLHQVVMSTCPYCAAQFVHSFDPFDMDGDWWSGARSAAEPCCAHYCVFQGAVSYGSARKPRGPYMGSARPGPEVPYVVPKQLLLPGMIAVIGELPMEPGWRAFPIVYFANPRPDGSLLSFEWGKILNYFISRKTGLRETSCPNEPWDFELEPWIARGKVRWCVPGSGNSQLAALSDRCPYVGLPGIRQRIEVESNGDLALCGVPDGS